jgi:hypothetical protein
MSILLLVSDHKRDESRKSIQYEAGARRGIPIACPRSFAVFHCNAGREETAGNDFWTITSLIQNRLGRTRRGHGGYTFCRVHGAWGLFYQNAYPGENSSLMVGCRRCRWEVGVRPSLCICRRYRTRIGVLPLKSSLPLD